MGCVLTYAERLTPLRSLRAHMREVLADDSGFSPHEEFMISRFLTEEGEFGAHMMVKGHRYGQPIAHIIAAVFTDYFSTRLTARVTNLDRLEEYRALVAELARTDRLALGRRRRRYAFQPPPDWHHVPDVGLEFAYFAPDYPKTRTCIIVSPAEPLSASPKHPRLMLEEIDERRGLTAPETTILTPPYTRHPSLTAEQWRSTRSVPGLPGKMVRYLIVLVDGRYYYPLRLEALEHSELDAEHNVLVELAGTIESLPNPVISGHAANESTDAFNMWND